MAEDKKAAPAATKDGATVAKKDGATVAKKDGATVAKKGGATVAKKGGATARKSRKPRNYLLPGGVMRFSRSRMYRKKGLWRIDKTKKTKKVQKKRKPLTITKPIGGEKNGGTRVVKLKKARKYYPTEERPRTRKCRKIGGPVVKTKYLRKRLTPGTVVIILAGRHRGKRCIFLKQLSSGLCLVTGPYRANGCPLRRINQIFLIATSTKIDMSEVNIPTHLNDLYFRRKKGSKKSKKDEAEIFETKKEGYVITDQRKKDQIEVDRQIIKAIRAHPEKKSLFGYLRAMFYLQNKMYPHKMRF